ncbi:MAG: carboxypeptidase regulatory-like domain-containing protein [Rikenellaceae bacterium]
MKKILLFLVAMFVSVASFAQVTTSGITGQITDTKGESLVGATVIAIHTPSGSEYGVATNSEGRYTIRGMRAGGPYTVTVSYIGYQTVEASGITLSLGENFTFSPKMVEGQQLDDVVVISTAADRFNQSKTGAASSFNSDAIAATPTTDRSVFDVVKMTPQASVSKDGGVIFAGASNRYNSFQVDGAMNNDVFGLTDTGTNGGSVTTNPLSLDALEAIQVVVAPFDVRQSGFTGGAINAITKSGTNDFKGSVYTYFNNQDFYGSTPGPIEEGETREKLGQQLTSTTGFTAGGALKKDKLFLFVNGEYYTESYPSSYYAGLDGYLSEADAQRVSDRYYDLTGVTDQLDQIDVTTESIDITARLDWNINKDHKLMFRYQFKDASAVDGTASQWYATFNNSGFTRDHSTNAFVLELNSRFSNDVSNEFHINYSRVRDIRTPDTTLPTMYITDDDNYSGTICLGTEYSSGINQLDQDIITLTDNVSIFKGNHTITVGTHNEFYSMMNGYTQYANGCFYYDTIDDFENGNASRYRIGYSDESIAGTDRWMASFNAAQFGFYVQDEWKPSDVFSLTYGIRADIPVMFTEPTENADFNASDVANNGQYVVGEAVSTKILWSPRVGFRYNLDETSLIRGGVGIFTGRVPFVWLSNIYSNTGMEAKTYSSSDIPTDLTSTYVPTSGTPSSTINVVSSDFKMPQVFRANVAWEKNFGDGWAMTLEALYSKTINNVAFVNVAFEDNGDTFNPVSASSDVSTTYYSQINSDYDTVISLQNTNKGYTYDLSAMLTKSFDFGLDLSASYSFGHSYSLNDAASSVANSNWKKNMSVDINSLDEVSFSRYDVPHRINMTATYTSPQYGSSNRFNTVVALTYQGYSGSRYSVGYGDSWSTVLNGTSEEETTLLYIPTDSEINEMSWASDADKTAFAEWCSTDSYAKNNRGQWSERYGAQNPFEHHFNLHVSEYFVYNQAKNSKIQLSLDVLNLGNMFNREWGMYYYQAYPGIAILDVESIDTTNGVTTATYSFAGEENDIMDIYSRWRMQLGLRITF